MMQFKRGRIQLALCLLVFCALKEAASIQPVLIVHGGAGDITDDKIQGKFDGMKAAVRQGYTVLLESDDPLSAVEQAVNVMENRPAFNAGYGSVLTSTGEVEMDALIINGTDLTAGGVGAIRHVFNPISVARLVMERTQHVLLVGAEAENFAASQGVRIVPTECLIAKNITTETNDWGKSKSSDFDVGTVGAVAINSKGQIAVATSTGGMSGKLNGRVGDSPLIGAGTLADDGIGGISGTGWGEAFMRVRIASLVANHLEQGKSPSEAGRLALETMASRIPTADGGVIVISKTGEVGYSFNSRRMGWAYAQDNITLNFGIDHGEHNTEPFGSNSTEPILPPDCDLKLGNQIQSSATNGARKIVSLGMDFRNLFRPYRLHV